MTKPVSKRVATDFDMFHASIGHWALVVDDLTERADRIQQAIDGPCTFAVQTMPRYVLQQPHELWRFFTICLDFDMCEAGVVVDSETCPNPSKYGGCDCLTGLDVARVLVAQQYAGRIVLISGNPVGLDRMEAELQGLDVVRCSATNWTGPDAYVDNMIREAVDG